MTISTMTLATLVLSSFNPRSAARASARAADPGFDPLGADVDTDTDWRAAMVWVLERSETLLTPAALAGVHAAIAACNDPKVGDATRAAIGTALAGWGSNNLEGEEQEVFASRLRDTVGGVYAVCVRADGTPLLPAFKAGKVKQTGSSEPVPFPAYMLSMAIRLAILEGLPSKLRSLVDQPASQHPGCCTPDAEIVSALSGVDDRALVSLLWSKLGSYQMNVDLEGLCSPWSATPWSKPVPGDNAEAIAAWKAGRAAGAAWATVNDRGEATYTDAYKDREGTPTQITPRISILNADRHPGSAQAHAKALIKLAKALPPRPTTPTVIASPPAPTEEATAPTTAPTTEEATAPTTEEATASRKRR